jgi:hypothetical protein
MRVMSFVSRVVARSHSSAGRVRVITVKAIAGGIVGLAPRLFALLVMIVTDGGDNLVAIGYLHDEMVGQGGYVFSFQW